MCRSAGRESNQDRSDLILVANSSSVTSRRLRLNWWMFDKIRHRLEVATNTFADESGTAKSDKVTTLASRSSGQQVIALP